MNRTRTVRAAYIQSRCCVRHARLEASAVQTVAAQVRAADADADGGGGGGGGERAGIRELAFRHSAPLGVRVNVIAGGHASTPRMGRRAALALDRQGIQADLHQPSPRWRKYPRLAA